MSDGRCQHCGSPYSAPPSQAARRKYCSRACYHTARKGKFLRETNPTWKGGRTVIAGRPCVYAPGHPRAMKGMGYVYESILIAEAALGRPLRWFGFGDPDNEVVHHINGDPAESAPGNLLICTDRYHRWLHNVAMKTPEQRRQKGLALATGRWGNRNGKRASTAGHPD